MSAAEPGARTLPRARPFPSIRQLQPAGVVALLVISASVFYLAPWPPLYAPAFLAVVILTWWRLDLSLALVVLFAPYFMAPKHFGSKEFAPSEIFLAVDCCIAVLYTLGLRQGTRPNWAQLLRSPLLLPATLFLVAGALSTAVAADRHEALRAFREVILEPEIFFALLLLFSPKSEHWRLLLGAVVAAGLAVGLIALVQFVSRQDVTYVAGSSIPRVLALYGSADNLGLLYDRVVPVWFAAAMLAAVSRRWRWAVWLPALVFGPVLLLTFSRGAWLAVGLACLFILALTVSWGRRLALACVLLGVLSIVVAGPALLHVLRSGHANTVHLRFDLWQSGLSMVRAHPLAGIGPDNFLHYYAPPHQPYASCHGLGYMKPEAWSQPCLSHPHDELLDFWLSTGIAGLAAFFWLQVVFWRSALLIWRRDRAPRETAILLGCAAAMLASLIHGLVDNSYFLMDLAVLFWLFCATMSFLATSRAEESPPGSRGSVPTGFR